MQATRRLFDILEGVKDPEIPVLNVVEMGIVRDASEHEGGVRVTITPTYSGCPAMDTIANDIVAELKRHDIDKVQVDTVFAPPWTTDWMTDSAKQKMRKYGIAPPNKSCASPFKDPNAHTSCPYCGGVNTELRSAFGSTACKALHYCNQCHEPFEYFKCI